MSFPRYSAYRESGVKWLCALPAHWSVKRFKSVFVERVDRSEHGDELLLSVSAYTGVSPRSELLEDGDHLSRSESLEGYKRCFKDDLVVNIMLAWNRGLAFTEFDGIVSPAYCVYKVVDGSDPAFLNYLVRSDEYITYFKAFSSGVIDSRLRIYPETFGALYCSLPPLEEQTAIASFLDHETAKIDVLVAEQEKLITLLKEKHQAVISQAVTKGLDPTVPMRDSGVEWLGDVPQHWVVAAVNYRYEVLLGKMLDEKRITGLNLAPYLRNVDVQWDHVNVDELPQMDFADDEVERYGLRPGDLLVCEGGEVGRAAIWRGELEECYYQKALHRLRPRNSDADVSRFQLYLMQMAAKLGVFTGGEGKSTIAHLTAEALRRYRFAYPSKPEQEQIVVHLDEECRRLDLLVAEASRAIDLLSERRSALISAAVTGQIDVRGEATSRA